MCLIQGQITRGERYTLLRINGNKWDVKDQSGHTLTAPGVCFIIPPTDQESISIADKCVFWWSAHSVDNNILRLCQQVVCYITLLLLLLCVPLLKVAK